MADYGLQTASLIGAASYAGGDVPVEETAFGALSNALDRSNLLSRRVMQLADRLVGSFETAGSDAANVKPPSAVFPTVRQASYETQAMVQEALNALDRIERALP